MDSSAVARQASDFIDELEEDLGDGAEIEAFVMVADVRLPEDHESGCGGVTRWHHGDLSPVHALGLVVAASAGLAEGRPVE